MEETSQNLPVRKIHIRDGMRYGGGDPCARGCGGVSTPSSIYCESCLAALYENHKITVPPSEHELDVVTEVLKEQIRGENKIQKALAEKGPGKCHLCGRPSLPWRIYCSPQCRGRNPRIKKTEVEIDGVMDTFLGHARRRGICDNTYSTRIRRGMDPIEALNKPVQFRGPNKKKKS